jgi:uncharacterized protein
MLTPTTSAFKPVAGNDRIITLDITRGIALLGILLMNIIGFGLGPWAYGNPAIAGGDTGLNLKVFEIASVFFEGTMRGLFSLLFGVSVVLLTDRLIKKEAGIRVADIYFTRTIWLIIFGVIHAYLLLWWGEVLYAYGVMGLLLFVFRDTKPKYILMLVGFLVLADTGRQYLKYDEAKENKLIYLTYESMSEQEKKEAAPEIIAGKKGWEEMNNSIEDQKKKMDEYKDNTQKGYFGAVAGFAPFNRMIQMELYEWGIYDILSIMLLGIALYRLKIITAEKSYRFYLIMMLIGYPAGILINYHEFNLLVSGEFSSMAFSEASVTYPIGRIFILFGHIGTIMIFCKSNWLPWLRLSLASVGRMALTNYIMHSVICMFLFYGFGFGMFGAFERYELYYIVGAIWLFQLIYSPIWLRYFRYGPLEWLWRSLTYKKWQPFRKKVPVPQMV